MTRQDAGPNGPALSVTLTEQEMIRLTPHPDWVQEFLKVLLPFRRKIVRHRLFRELADGRLSSTRLQGALINFYPLIDSFPKFMALNLAKIEPGGDCSKQSRSWLSTNINTERRHAEWWKDFASGFGVDRRVFEKEISPPPQIDALNEYLWRISTYGSLAEGISAVNFSIEGPTGEWTKAVEKGVRIYSEKEGATPSKKTLRWITAHATYDDKHPEEALELIKLCALTKKDQQGVITAAERAMEFYALALDGCYSLRN